MKKLVLGLLAAGTVAVVAANLPDIKRYLRMREM
ncbi:DUF6893 family small protein [Streptomyces beihaiensis]